MCPISVAQKHESVMLSTSSNNSQPQRNSTLSENKTKAKVQKAYSHQGKENEPPRTQQQPQSQTQQVSLFSNICMSMIRTVTIVFVFSS